MSKEARRGDKDAGCRRLWGRAKSCARGAADSIRPTSAWHAKASEKRAGEAARVCPTSPVECGRGGAKFQLFRGHGPGVGGRRAGDVPLLADRVWRYIRAAGASGRGPCPSNFCQLVGSLCPTRPLTTRARGHFHSAPLSFLYLPRFARLAANTCVPVRTVLPPLTPSMTGSPC